MNNPNLESIKSKIQNIAKKEGKQFNEMWQRLVLERFLTNISNSIHRDKFIFKGGMLLSFYIPLGRETVDLDFLMTKVDATINDVDKILEDFNTAKEDDFSFKYLKITELAHDHMEYGGFKAYFLATFGNTKTRFTIDIGFGDTVTPVERKIESLGKIYEENISLLVYPLEVIFAEKLETIVNRAEQNSRMKDYYDLLLMVSSNKLDNNKIKDSVISTFSRRGTALPKTIEINPNNSFLTDQWKNFSNRLGLDKNINLATIIETINDYLRTFLI